jgi:prolipoprotein diacylglyceryl transferase
MYFIHLKILRDFKESIPLFCPQIRQTMFAEILTSMPFIIWDVQPEIIPDSSVPLRWYGLMFAAAFLFGQYFITKIFKAEGKSEKDVDALTYYMIGATIIGARLGHCLFYQPEIYLNDPISILKVWEGGLASHGATVGIIFAMWLYSRNRPDQSWLWILDRIVIVVALGGMFIRTGNLMNSEILGKPGNHPWSMVFVEPFQNTLKTYEGERIEHISFSKSHTADTTIDGKVYAPIHVDLVFVRDRMPGSSEQAFLQSSIPSMIKASNGEEEQLYYNPQLAQVKSGFDEKGRKTLQLRLFGLLRHPAMIYEAISCFILFVLMYRYWNRNVGKVQEGRIFSVFVIVLFTLRFFYEFLKENQVAFESGLTFNMGQNLSIPLVLVGIFILVRSFRKQEEAPQ